MFFIQYPKCTTCKKAKAWLDSRRVDYVDRHIKEDNPSYQTLDREGKYLYSVHGDLTKVSSYKILPDHTLEHLNTIDIGGKNPVDVTVDKENRHVIVPVRKISETLPQYPRKNGIPAKRPLKCGKK